MPEPTIPLPQEKFDELLNKSIKSNIKYIFITFDWSAFFIITTYF